MIIYLVLFYILFLLLFLGFSAAGLYHLIRFGYAGDLTKPVAIFYIVFSAIVIIITILFLLGLDWSAPILG